MIHQEKENKEDILEKHTPFFNWAKRYFWLIDEQNIGNIERAIIKEYHLEFTKMMKEISLEEFRWVWIKLSMIHVEVLFKKKNDLTKDIKPENVLDFLND